MCLKENTVFIVSFIPIFLGSDRDTFCFLTIDIQGKLLFGSFAFVLRERDF